MNKKLPLHANHSRRLLTLGLLAIFVFMGLASSSLSFAQTTGDEIIVNTTVDSKERSDGECSLREAIIAANRDRKSGRRSGECRAGSGTDVILLPEGVYTLTRSNLGVESYASSGDLDIRGSVTIRPRNAGDIVIISGEGITDRVFHIHYGTVVIDGITIRDGDESSKGGAIYQADGELTVRNSTLTSNTASYAGGAIYGRSTTNLEHVTVKDNSSPRGSGLFVDSEEDDEDDDCDDDRCARLIIKNSLIADNTCRGPIEAEGSNLAYSANGCPGDPGNPQLTAETFADKEAYFVPGKDGSAYDAYAGPCSLSTDQIGTERPQNGACDIGAIEYGDTNNPPLATDDIDSSNEDTPVIINISANDSDDEDELDYANDLNFSDGPANGSIVNNGDGTVTYTPDRHYFGTDVFHYEICDTAGECDTAIVTVTIVSDRHTEVTNLCDSGVGSFRWAINQANEVDETTFENPWIETIVFDLSAPTCETTANTINLVSELPELLSPVIIDGLAVDPADTFSHDPNTSAYITLNGGGNSFSGITIGPGAAGSTIANLIIRNFGGSGIVIGDIGSPSDDNLIAGNEITNNGFANPSAQSVGGAVLDDGITIVAGVDNAVSSNNIYNNSNLSVDLGADGPTPNDPGDGDTGANFVQNYPDLYAVSLQGDISGILNSVPNSSYDLQFFSSESCQNAEALTLLNATPIEVTTDELGYAVFTARPGGPLQPGTGVRATATDADGNTSEYSNCVPASENNVVWTQAKVLTFDGATGTASTSQFLGTVGEARWYKFSVQPGSEITIDLTSLPANYDLTVYKDIAQTYSQLLANNLDDQFDLDRLGAETPAEVVASTAFAPSAYTPTAYTPTAYTPTAYTPTAYTPTAYTPTAYTPTAYTQDVIAPTAYTPTAYTPTAYTPTAYTPTAYTPNDTLAVDPALYSSAQLSSLIAVSAFDNLANESVTINTWTNDGEYYLRVRGRNGAFAPDQFYNLEVTQVSANCSLDGFTGLSGDGASVYYDSTDPSAPNTVIVIDRSRLAAQYPDASADLNQLDQELIALAERPEVDGVIVEVGQAGSLIAALNNAADLQTACPYGKNLVAEEIKQVIDNYRSDELEYVVIVGSDDVVPFFRVPDSAWLGPESWYQPPVSVFTSSEASLRGNFILTDDYYGAKYGVSYKDASIPAVDLATGRLVESPQDMLNQLAAYGKLTGGVVNSDGSSLQSTVTGYDFLVDAVEKISTELEAGTGLAPQELITPYGVAPLNDLPFDQGGPWTAADLLTTLDNNTSDIIFLAGHFSASTALAADFQTGISTLDFLELTEDENWENVIVYSAGCHSGYNIVDQHSTPFTLNPDWASAFASKGSLLIGGTGYQYGDTDFIEYSERLYLYFTQQLRAANAGQPVSVGQAMVAAKQQYLAETPVLRGIHQKALIEATIFGLPMLSVDMPNRLQDDQADSIVTEIIGADVDTPGFALGLKSTTKTLNFAPSLRTVTLEDKEGGTSLLASWLSGDSGVLTNLGEPALPLYSANVSPPPTDVTDGYTLRGIGFRGGTYADINDINQLEASAESSPIYPLVGAATTEIRAVHLNFLSAFWFPLRTWSVNLFDNLFNGSAGETTLFITPAQYKTEDLSLGPPPPSTLRRFDSMSFQLFYSNYTKATETDADGNSIPSENQPSLASPPNIAQVVGTPNGAAVDVEALVVGNPGAGIQTVWVTYTGESGALHGSWTSTDLVQDADDSRIWRGSFETSGTPMDDVRFIIQACSGTGVCSLVDNVGQYFAPGADINAAPTTLTQPGAANGAANQKVGDEVTFSATLAAPPGTDVSNRPIFFGLGQESRLGLTNGNGQASATFLLVSAPGDYEVTAWFPGDNELAASTSSPLPFEVIQQATTLTISGPTAPVLRGETPPVVALLRDQSASQLPLAEQAVLFAVFDGNQSCPATDEAAQVAGAAAYKTVYTGLQGEANLGDVDLAGGVYTVCAYFREIPSYAGSATTGFSLIINSQPVANDDSYTIEFGQSLSVSSEDGVLANDSDDDGDALEAVLVTGASNGSLVLASDGSFEYVFNPNAIGDTFTYEACDAYGACDQATVSIMLSNTPPVCDNVFLTAEGGYDSLWPPNKRQVNVYLSGATDLEDDANGIPLEYFFLNIRQDEKVKGQADAQIFAGCTDAWVRADRDGRGDGRVYEIEFLVRDSDGATCTGFADIATLPHDQGGDSLAIKGNKLWSSGSQASCTPNLP